MNAPMSPSSGISGRSIEIGPMLALLGAGTALAIALSIGNPTPDLRLASIGVIGTLVMTMALIWPFAALLVMFSSCILQVVWVVTNNRAANAIDVLLLPMLLGGAFGAARRDATEEDSLRTGPEHRAIRRATHWLTRSTVTFYAIAAFSLVLLGLRDRWNWAFDSSLLLLRAMQGISLFVLGLWWLRSDGHIRAAIRSVEFGAWMLIGVNLWFIVASQIPRAGMTFIVNMPEWPITSPNEAAITLLVVLALLQSRPRGWRGPTHILLVPLLIVMLVLTQSRSGLFAWLVYGALSIRWRWSAVLRAAMVVAVTAPFIPGNYWGRLGRTLSPGDPSVEAYGSIIRLYSWQTAWKVFQDHPLFGVGYMGFRFISVQYNDMRIVLNTVENYFFEVTTGMGLPGLIALIFAVVALLRLDTPIRAVAVPGTFCHEMARRHRPLILALLAANLTGDNFMGMVGLAQIAMWCALLIRSGHHSAATHATT